jgi:DNA excision repair protein ERCC-4
MTPDWQRKRRKVASEMNRGGRLDEDEVQQRELLDEAVEASEKDLDQAVMMAKHKGGLMAGWKATTEAVDDDDDDVQILGVTTTDNADGEEDDGLLHTQKLDDELTVMFRTFADAEGEHATFLLSDLNPSTIILYDANPSFIRSIEIHSAIMAQTYIEKHGPESESDPPRLKVYFTLFEHSAEEKVFMKSLEREQNAFEKLIMHMKSMPLMVNTMTGMTQELQQSMMATGTGAGGTYANGALPLAVDTRSGRGAASAKLSKVRRDIAVDVREFRSALPSVLHQGGMRLAPVTLTVGDFVLSPVHCVERKSISDLFGSFQSGRLFTQAEQMAKHYKCPCLLIEFEPTKSFCLQSVNQLGADIKTDSVCSKLCLLTMHVPSLRILWSKEQHETLKIFKVLKTNHEEVNVEKSVEIGSNESLDDLLGNANTTNSNNNNETTNEINETARDLLLRLPGVNTNNARKIMSACDTLAELAEMSREQLRELIGPISGQKLFSFLRQRIAT